MYEKKPVINEEYIMDYINYLREQERSKATLQKYQHDLTALIIFLNGSELTKTELINWKESLMNQYAPASVNAMIAAVNGYVKYMGWVELMVKPLKIQRSLFLEEEKELTREEYVRLVKAAQKKENERLALVIQTICATGIRVSELKFITVEAVQCGRAEISNKGKLRIVFLPEGLRKLLRKYIRNQKKTAGAVFTTRTGKPLDRSNIWRDMKKLCESAGVSEKKVFPHNLRHLFARTFYSIEKDLSRLADILGHTNLSTTRIYTAESGAVHARQMERLKLIVT
ncbi:tyrosine-type recombinase/integrase [Blautia sp. MSJ-9]|uniref:tyrosine-type recombinase/integrase n=1 Tax=Blautia sp. MSJ-9 TaxID=2841511 RepID=UPI001C101932|nr:tyrosine-type recombinase/integrase [Blautia sp. MSJ-9]MBU5681209.1 tyrosine-type recombinase/integrase [Blautia sp. MSJ-9]